MSDKKSYIDGNKEDVLSLHLSRPSCHSFSPPRGNESDNSDKSSDNLLDDGAVLNPNFSIFLPANRIRDLRYSVDGNSGGCRDLPNVGIGSFADGFDD